MTVSEFCQIARNLDMKIFPNMVRSSDVEEEQLACFS